MEGRYGLCMAGGGWTFGHLIDGLQAEFARVHPVHFPEGEKTLVATG
jgi:threonine dehydrogenase-like Zn-dependent dehydrogenase